MLFSNLGKQTSIKTGVYHIGIIIIDPSGVARCLRAAAPAGGRQVAHRAAPCALRRLRGGRRQQRQIRHRPTVSPHFTGGTDAPSPSNISVELG